MKQRIYIDTSVVGGYFDDEFSADTLLFFDRVISGELTIIVSELLEAELLRAPDFVKEFFKLSENYAWKIHPQREEFQGVNDIEGYIKEIFYRPFDKRNIFYQPNIVFRMRTDVMRHMLKENLALCTVRQVKTGDRWQHILASQKKRP